MGLAVGSAMHSRTLIQHPGWPYMQGCPTWCTDSTRQAPGGMPHLRYQWMWSCLQHHLSQQCKTECIMYCNASLLERKQCNQQAVRGVQAKSSSSSDSS